MFHCSDTDQSPGKIAQNSKDLGMGEQEIINALKLANNNEVQFLQERVDYLRNQLMKLEIDVKNKEYNLSTLDNRTRQITYRATPLDDKSIRPVSIYEVNEKK